MYRNKLNKKVNKMIEKYNEIITSKGTLNSNLIISKKFLDSNLCKELIKDTKCLDIFPNISINARASFLIHNLKLSYCKICKKPYVEINQVRYKLCNHHQVLKTRECYGKDRKNEIFNYLNNNNFKEFNFSDDEILLINEKIKTLNSLKYVFKTNIKIFNYVIKETIDILPDLNTNLNERLYVLKNGIKEIPKCNICGKNLKFLNKNIGYDICECKKLIQQNKIEKINDLFENNKDFIWKNNDEFFGLNKTKIIYTHKKCGKDSSIWLWNGKLNSVKNLKCEHCNPVSSGQYDVEQFIKSLGFSIKENFRPENRLEVDIFIEDKKIGFEFNGTYWHRNDKLGKDYHLNKINYFNNLGYKIVNIWEYDWLNPDKQNILKEKIKAILGIDQTKIYARKCLVKEISIKEKNEFLNLYHIQGEDKSSIKLGLFFENELIGVMTFGKPRFNKKYEWELIRYATKSGLQVLGGAGKLLKYFERNFNPKSIITYADRSYSQGNMYRKIGFTELKPAEPNYQWINGTRILSRYQCQKHRLKEILGDKFNENLSESENMIVNGFIKVFDCGNLVFIKEY